MEKDTILYVLTKSQEYLGKRLIPNPRLDAELILSELLNMERIKLYSNFDRILTEPEKDSYREKIKARGTFKPVAYITGKKNFYKSSFFVDESVLIPRPETEELIEWVSSGLVKESTHFVLDLCTGSGCIGISLKKDFPSINLWLSDISKDALVVAQKNASILIPDQDVNFCESDLYEQMQDNLQFDLIVSNPPYIPIDEKKSMMSDVIDFEPHLALFLNSPEEFYKRLLSGSYNRLKEGGSLYLETHPDWVAIIEKMSLSYNYKSTQSKKDLSNKQRFVKITK